MNQKANEALSDTEIEINRLTGLIELCRECQFPEVEDEIRETLRVASNELFLIACGTASEETRRRIEVLLAVVKAALSNAATARAHPCRGRPAAPGKGNPHEGTATMLA